MQLSFLHFKTLNGVNCARINYARISCARISRARISCARISRARINCARISCARVSRTGRPAREFIPVYSS